MSDESLIPDAGEGSSHKRIDPLLETIGQAIVDCGF